MHQYRDSLPCGKIEIFDIPSGNKVGRVWSLDDMHATLRNAGIVIMKRLQFLDGISPALVLAVHADAAEMTSFSIVLCIVARFISLRAIARNPAAVLLLALFHDKESSAILDQFWHQYFMPAVRNAQARHSCVAIRCFN